ncbi:MAG: family 20 glycosylhydrolase [Clostridia bacterium]|nr:family 20 glycosylhydrolase [Clostridia bacterium]
MFEYRGFMLDSARHMQKIEEIKKLIDTLPLLKINKFHWHLTDDQGWRFESEKFPELNSAGIRPYSDFGKTYVNEPHGRVYTKDEMREIVAYCAERGIEVIPEFDIPGHTSALLSAIPYLSCTGEDVKIKTHQGIFKDVLCLAKEETYNTVIQIIDEFLEIFPGEYFHIGGDETPSKHWKSCPECQKHMKELGVENYTEYQNCFMNRIVDYLESKGRHCIVWNDSAKAGNLDKRAIIQYWKESPKPTVSFLNEGGKAILSPFSYCYFDYDYNITPLNRTYSLKADLPGLTEEGKKNIIGIEGTLWTEYVTENQQLEKLIFPRLIALSKVALGESGKPYNEFIKDVQEIKNQLKGIEFCDEKDWTKPRASMIYGWLKYVRENITIDFVKELIS